MALMAQHAQLHRQQAACNAGRPLAAPSLSSSRCGGHRMLLPCPAAAAASMSAGALAIYSWPLKPAVQQPPVTRSPAKLWSTQMWFEAMVQTVVKQLDGGAFLLRVGINPVLSLQLVRLDAADLAAGWEHIQQQHLTAALQQDEAVILVHPVASAEQPCVVKQTAGSACPGCPHTTAAAAATAAAAGGGVTAAFSAGGATELLHGKFGDCCNDTEHDHSHHSHHTSSSSSQHRPPAQPETVKAFYGLVVQTRDATDPLQGCYLLKTVKQSSSSSSSSCHCTHYSLNQVCKGPSLQKQYQASWLV